MLSASPAGSAGSFGLEWTSHTRSAKVGRQREIGDSNIRGVAGSGMPFSGP
jgi:hypothetical protein